MEKDAAGYFETLVPICRVTSEDTVISVPSEQQISEQRNISSLLILSIKSNKNKFTRSKWRSWMDFDVSSQQRASVPDIFGDFQHIHLEMKQSLPHSFITQYDNPLHCMLASSERRLSYWVSLSVANGHKIRGLPVICNSPTRKLK